LPAWTFHLNITNIIQQSSNWRWHINEVFVKTGGKTHYLWRAVDHEGEALDAVVTKRRDKKSALKVLKSLIKRYGRPMAIVTDNLRSYKATMKELGCQNKQEAGGRLNNPFNGERHLVNRHIFKGFRSEPITEWESRVA